MFGFACDQSPTLMPLPIWLAHKMARRLAVVREDGMLPYLMPDGKVQVGVEYRDRKPFRVHSATITASQRSPRKPSLKQLTADILETVFTPIFDDEAVKPDKKTRVFVNPTGVFLGGPSHHSGLTGRKNAVDTYGEFSRQSGDALSGKDPMRIDRVGSLCMARYAAKNVVAAGLATECEVALSYSIGMIKPASLQVNTFGTSKKPEEEILKLIQTHFDFRLGAILKQFNVRHLPSLHPEGFYRRLAAYGHVGREDMDLPWENTDKAQLLAAS